MCLRKKWSQQSWHKKGRNSSMSPQNHFRFLKNSSLNFATIRIEEEEEEQVQSEWTLMSVLSLIIEVNLEVIQSKKVTLTIETHTEKLCEIDIN